MMPEVLKIQHLVFQIKLTKGKSLNSFLHL